MIKAKKITSIDIAKKIGVEKEFKKILIEEELKETKKNFIESSVEQLKMII